MDKELILAVAGSGKSSHIIEQLDLDKRFLIITYTINNEKNLKEGIIQKFGYHPNNIDLFRYYNFLYHFCFLPFLGYKVRARGYSWDQPPEYTNLLKRDNLRYYLTHDRRLYHNRVAKLLETYGVIEDINQRLNNYYDSLFIDEVQDFAGHDFNLVKSMLEADLRIILVGDFYQHTFDTSRDGRTNSTIHDEYTKYIKQFKNIKIDIDYLNKSWRCSPSVCEFITINLGINISSHKKENSDVKYIDDPKLIENIFNDNMIVKLFYKESHKYNCYSKNWGECKGENLYHDVCVVLNATSFKHFKAGTLNKLPPISKNKLYVACSRAKNNLYLLPETLIKKYKIES